MKHPDRTVIGSTRGNTFNASTNFGVIVDGSTIILDSDDKLTIDGIDANLAPALTLGQKQAISKLRAWAADRNS